MSERQAGWLMLSCGTLFVLAACDRRSDSVNSRIPRPVTVVSLESTIPEDQLMWTGAVEAWDQQELSFQVAGRVEWVIERDVNVEGQSLDEQGNMVDDGAVLARLDSARYELAVAAAQAQLNALVAETEAKTIELEQVVPEDLRAAESVRDQLQKEYERFVRLTQANAAAASSLEEIEAQLRTSRADVAKVHARENAVRAELASLEARTNQQTEAMREARLDLSDCSLRAPFRGRVSEVHVIPGGYVTPGQPVVSLIVMDPLRILVNVSPSTDRAIHEGDTIRIYPPNSEAPTLGRVWRKDTVADAATRTFQVAILVRNRRVLAESDLIREEWLSLPRVNELWGVQPIERADKTAYYTEKDTLYEDEKGFYLLKADGVRLDRVDQTIGPVIRVSKVRVQPGKRRVSLLGQLTMRELVDLGGLTAGDALVRGAPPEVRDGDEMLYARERWRMRPGDLVRVSLSNVDRVPGFYVSTRTISREEGRVFVYRVTGGVAERVEVALHENIGSLWRIESAELAVGDQIVIDGGRYLLPGDEVRIVETTEGT